MTEKRTAKILNVPPLAPSADIRALPGTPARRLRDGALFDTLDELDQEIEVTVRRLRGLPDLIDVRWSDGRRETIEPPSRRLQPALYEETL